MKEVLSRWFERIRRKYRVVFLDEESLRETGRFSLRPLQIYLLSFGLILVGGALTWLIIWLGWGPRGTQSGPSEQEYSSLQQKVALLEHQVAEQDSIRKTFARVAGVGTGEGVIDTSLSSSLSQTPSSPPPSSPPASPQVQGETISVNPKPNAQGAGPSENRPQAPRASSKYIPDIQVMNLVSPVDGIISMPYVSGENHFGIDLVADENSLIRSCADGVVIFSEYSSATGYVVGIAHNQYNLISFYKHNSKVFPSVGSYVFGGEAIAVIGNTGKNSSGTHLHFELWYGGNPINPGDYIKFN